MGNTIILRRGGGSSGAITNPVTITSGTIDGTTIGRTNTDQSLPVTVAVTDTTKTLAITDANTIQECSNGSAQAITIPLNAAVAFAVDTVLVFHQQGIGAVTVTGDTGVTVNGISGGSVVTTAQYTALYIMKTATDTWMSITATTGITSLTGDVTAAGTGSVGAIVNSVNGKTVTLGGNFTTSGAFVTTLTVTGDSNVTLPTTGTLAVNGLTGVGTILSDLIFTDATYDIGKSGATRPRNIFASATITGVTGTFTGAISAGSTVTATSSVVAGAANSFLFTGRSRITSPADAQLLLMNNGSSFPAAVLHGRLVEANTAGSGAPNVLTALESGTVLTNEGSTAANYHTLPTAAANLTFTFIVQDTDGIRITANTGDTIRIAATVSSAAGYITSATIGDAVTLIAINATEWVATSIVGAVGVTWTAA